MISVRGAQAATINRRERIDREREMTIAKYSTYEDKGEIKMNCTEWANWFSEYSTQCRKKQNKQRTSSISHIMRPPRQCSQLSKGTRQKLLHEYDYILIKLNRWKVRRWEWYGATHERTCNRRRHVEWRRRNAEMTFSRNFTSQSRTLNATTLTSSQISSCGGLPGRCRELLAVDVAIIVPARKLWGRRDAATTLKSSRSRAVKRQTTINGPMRRWQLKHLYYSKFLY